MDHLSAAPAVALAADEDSAEHADVYKALADPSRRLLLDSLFVEDGQTLGELAARLPAMTRFGVMKHLRILEAADLVTSRKVGRERMHYLNPVPIRLIHDRWIGKYAEPWVGALAGLKVSLEGAPVSPKLRQVFQVYIRTTPNELWHAITDAELTRRYFRGARVDSVWRPGTRMRYWIDGRLVVDGQVLDVDRPRRLVTTWSFQRDPRMRNDPPSRVTWEIEPVLGACKLTLVHDSFPSETATFKAVGSDWPLVLSSLKSLLETGKELALAQPDTDQ